MHGPIEESLNIVALLTGLAGLVISWVLFRRYSSRDPVERLAASFFVFMQVAMISVEVFFWVLVVMRLSGHPLGVTR